MTLLQRHSLSLACAAIAVLFAIAGAFTAEGSYAQNLCADGWGAGLGGLLMAVFKKWFWEEGSKETE